MTSKPVSLIGATALGFAVAAACFSAWAPRPASAQFNVKGGLPDQIPNTFSVQGPTAPPSAQPIAVQALDSQHFVVASREPRLVQQVGRENTAQNMLVTVVTHYTVRGDKLIPVEHVSVPIGYHLVTIDGE